MGANTTAVNNNLSAIRVVMSNILDAINEVNMKAWETTAGEISELVVAQGLLTAVTNPTNSATVITTDAVTNTIAVACINAYKTIEVAVGPALDALRKRDWTGYQNLRPAIVTAIAAIDTASNNAQAGSASVKTAGASISQFRFQFAQTNSKMRDLADNILPMLDARYDKNYEEVESIYNLMKIISDGAASDTIPSA